MFFLTVVSFFPVSQVTGSILYNTSKTKSISVNLTGTKLNLEYRVQKNSFNADLFLFHSMFSIRNYFRQELPEEFKIQKQHLSLRHNSTNYIYRHLEINSISFSTILLPIPNFYFYVFILEHPYLWTHLLGEFYVYFRNLN